MLPRSEFCGNTDALGGARWTRVCGVNPCHLRANGQWDRRCVRTWRMSLDTGGGTGHGRPGRGQHRHIHGPCIRLDAHLNAVCAQAVRPRDEESGWRDLNPRPPAPKAGALPNCATARDVTKGTAEERPLSAHRAGDGNRTRAICLEGRGSTIELHPHG